MNFIPVVKSSSSGDQNLYFDTYPECEHTKLKELEKLLKDWFNFLKDKIEEKGIEDFVSDGFYPNYFSQNTKILFIGRESLGIAGCNYQEILWEGYTQENSKINRDKFHCRMFYLTYAILNNQFDYSRIPYASKLTASFGSNKMSFAFMNLSKLSNEAEHFAADWNKINSSYNNSSNFIQTEVQILEPDIIFTMNISGYIEKIFQGNLKKLDLENTLVRPYSLKLNGKKVLLIDTFHFSARKGIQANYLTPVQECIEKYKNDFGLNI